LHIFYEDVKRIEVEKLKREITLVCTSLHRFALLCIGLHRFAQVCTGLHWFALRGGAWEPGWGFGWVKLSF
jgi:hypothetical protein